MFNLQSSSASSSRYSLPASAPSPPPNANQTKRSSSYLSTGFTNLSISGIGSSSSNNDLASPAGRGGEMNILDRPINKSRGVEVGLPAWAFLFSEIVSYSQTRVDSVADLEKRSVGRSQAVSALLSLDSDTRIWLGADFGSLLSHRQTIDIRKRSWHPDHISSPPASSTDK